MHSADLTPDPAPDPARVPHDALDDLLARALGHEGFYACPPALLAAIVAEHVLPAWSLSRRALALAACVLLAVGALSALTGRLPSTDTPLLPALSAAPALLQLADVLPTADLLAQAPSIDGRLTPFAVALAGLLLAGGVLLARRWGVSTPERTPEIA